MSLFGRKEKREIERLRAQLSPEQIELADLNGKIEENKKELAGIQEQIEKATKKLKRVRQSLIETDEEILLQSFGFYTPHYSYTVSDEYKLKIKDIRDLQKDMIKNGRAVTGSTTWTINGKKSDGKKMVSDMQRLLLRAYNAECDDAIEHVRFNNIESGEKKITVSADAISKLGAMMGITITDTYVHVKLAELYLVYEYQLKKQEEKEAQKELRAQQREEAKIAKELEEARKEAEKEKKHYLQALEKLDNQIAACKNEDDLQSLNERRCELLTHVNDIATKLSDIDYRQSNQKAGYVYIISNIGSFGEGVYKIGMTRRLDPMERVDELGDASVPFNFDVHAMIFSDDAPKLEAALHNAFADKKVNFVNQRREFFRVSLDEIKRVIKENYDNTVEFVDLPPAEQYRQSILIQKESD